MDNDHMKREPGFPSHQHIPRTPPLRETASSAIWHLKWGSTTQQLIYLVGQDVDSRQHHFSLQLRRIHDSST